MKIVLIACCMLMKSAFAQDPDKALIKVQYTFIHVRDTTQRNNPYTENMFLLAGKNASLYTSFDRLDRSINITLQRMELEKSGIPRPQINAQIMALVSSARPVSGTEYYFFTKEHIFFSAEEARFMYLVEEPTPGINWKISKDTLSFSGTRCQKATTNFKGRNWTAWFATELPFASGPWKLNGLPGLILEAYDEKKEVQFKFAGIAKVKEGDMITERAKSLPETSKTVPGYDITRIELQISSGNRIRATRKEFDKLKTALGSQNFGSGGGGGGGVGANGAPVNLPVTRPVIPVVAKPVINNPIELP